MLKKTLITVGSFALISAVITGCTGYLQSKSNSEWADYKNWTKITEGRVSTGDPTGFLSGMHKGNEGYREIYVNDIGKGTVLGTAPYKYPVGTIVVKEQYKNKTKWESGKNPDLTVMVKVADSGSVEPTNWGFASGYGKVKYREFCAGCHSIAAKDDFVFTNEDFMSK